MNKVLNLSLVAVIGIFYSFSLAASIATFDATESTILDDTLKTKKSCKANSCCDQTHFDSDFYTKETFAATFSADSNLTAPLVDSAWMFYLNQNWPRLNDLFVRNDLQQKGIVWPPANGGFNTVDSIHFKIGERYDRYGNNYGFDSITGFPILTGSFTSPILDRKPYTFDQRALYGTAADYTFYYTIEILQEFEFTSQNATVIPWFGKSGLAKQNMWHLPKDPSTGYPYSFTKLAEMGLIQIKIISTTNKDYEKFVGKVIGKKQ
jgi:hypothetical protein